MTEAGAPPRATPAGLGRRCLALVYEALLLTALVLFGSLPFVMATQGAHGGAARLLLQTYVLLLAGVYFVWQWRRGQTLAMKTWRLRVVARDGTPLTLRQAVARYLYAVVSTLPGGAGFLWALLDRERLFLHDRLAGTRIVRTEDREKKAAREAPSPILGPDN